MISVLLKNEFRRRKVKNPHYSLRAFSQFLDIPSGRLSELISEKRTATLAMQKKICTKLQISEFFDSKTQIEDTRFQMISDESFAVISDWEHFAILSLMDTKNFQPDPVWIGKRLGIPSFHARLAFERLISVGLITKHGLKFKKTGKDVMTTDNRTNLALRQSHRQSLEQAISALDEIAIDLRDISSVTMTMDLKKMPAAKALIREFRRKMMAVMEASQGNEVYNLNIQFVPVTKINQSQK